MARVVVREATSSEFELVVELVERLLSELGEEGDEAGTLDHAALLNAWRSGEARQVALLAHTDDGLPVGVTTLVEAFAIYANGSYGIINEMYVAPSHRSTGVGVLLLDAAKALGRARGWRRIDVTAPESPRWDRTRQFYERNGFAFTGPKLKCLLSI